MGVCVAADKRSGIGISALRIPRTAMAEFVDSWECIHHKRLFANRFACQTAKAMPPDTAAVIIGSTHWGEKCDRRAKISPMKVTIALIVTCRVTLSVVRSICIIRATATTEPTTPQTAAMRTCSKLNADPPRAITRKQASQAPANFSAAGRARPVANESLNVFRRLKWECSTDLPSSRCVSFSASFAN